MNKTQLKRHLLPAVCGRCRIPAFCRMHKLWGTLRTKYAASTSKLSNAVKVQNIVTTPRKKFGWYPSLYKLCIKAYFTFFTYRRNKKRISISFQYFMRDDGIYDHVQVNCEDSKNSAWVKSNCCILISETCIAATFCNFRIFVLNCTISVHRPPLLYDLYS